MNSNEWSLMVLVKFIGSLEKRQTAEQAAQPINDYGLVVCFGKPLEGAHGIKGIEITLIVFEHGVVGNVAPFFLNYFFCKITVQRIAMGQAAIVDGRQGILCNPLAAGSDAA